MIARPPDPAPAAPAEAVAAPAATARRTDEALAAIPVGLRIAGAWSWRTLAVIALAGVGIWLVIQLHIVVVPVLVATLLSGLLTPIKLRLRRAGLPRWLAVLLPFVGTLVVIAGLVTLVVLTFRTGLAGFEARVVTGYRSLLAAL
jgi:predicted PurR-regulated permease PerM